MNDRPTLVEILDAVRHHLETNIIPAVKGDSRVYFQTLVAVNLLKIAGRDAEMGYTQQLEAWTAIEGHDANDTIQPDDLARRLEGFHAALCDAIRRGERDTDIHAQSALYQQMRALTERALQINNPKFLDTLAAGDAEKV